MRKLSVKLGNATIYPPWGQVFKNYLFQKHTSTSSEMLDLLRRWHLKGIDEKNQGYFDQGPYKLKFYVKLVDPLLFQENW